MDLIIQTAVAYISALDLHTKLIGVCWEKHKATEEAYESLFDVLHDTAEKIYATSKPEIDDEVEIQKLYDTIESLKESYNNAIKEEKDEGVKNQLIQSYDSLQQICAKLYSVIEKDNATS